MPQIAEIFECPECGCHCVDEIQSGATITQAVAWVNEAGCATYGHQHIDGGYDSIFRCKHCGWDLEYDKGLAQPHLGPTTMKMLFDFLTESDCPCKLGAYAEEAE
jgi:rubredoxin